MARILSGAGGAIPKIPHPPGNGTTTDDTLIRKSYGKARSAQLYVGGKVDINRHSPEARKRHNQEKNPNKRAHCQLPPALGSGHTAPFQAHLLTLQGRLTCVCPHATAMTPVTHPFAEYREKEPICQIKIGIARAAGEATGNSTPLNEIYPCSRPNRTRRLVRYSVI